jgi:hypothetical protein
VRKSPDRIVEDGQVDASLSQPLGLATGDSGRPDDLRPLDDFDESGGLQCMGQPGLITLIDCQKIIVNVFASI